ncbi:MAG: PAS domain-containing protein [Ferruginibacter sp.]
MSIDNSDYYFLKGGGEMGEQIRAKDWSKTSLGDPAGWPQSLRTMVAVMLDNPFGMYIAWGDDYIQLYNDGYRPILGVTKHPYALGISTRETFEEIWHIIGPMFDGVLQGKAVGFPDFMLPLNRNGFVEECFFDFSYSPIRKDDGEVGGVLVTVLETTNKKIAEEALKESEQRFKAMADNIPNLGWMADAEGWIFWYNKKWYDYTGTSLEQMEGWGWQSIHDPAELPLVLEKWHTSISTGNPFEMVFSLKGADSKFRQFLSRVVPVRNNDGKILQWFGSNTDITAQKEIEKAFKESEQRFRETVKQAPVGITILRGNEFIVEMANDAYLQLIDRQETSFVGSPLFQSLPEVKESVHTLLDTVLNTGVPYHGNEVPVPINRYGKQEVFYFDFLYYPLKEADGNISGIIVTATEVSEKVTARKKIEESEERYHNLIYSSPSAIGILHGENLIITIANDAIIEIWGKGKEIMGKSYFEALPELAEQGYREVFEKVYKTGVPFNAVETPVSILQNGTMEDKYYNFLLYPQRNINNEVDGIGIIATEVTSQAILNKQVHESEKRFRLLADSMPQLIWTADIEGRLNYFNKSVLDYSGLALDQINEDGWLQIVHPGEREGNTKEWMNSIATGKDFSYEHRFKRYDGEYRWQLSRAIPQRDENGKIQMWVGTSTDIQEQKIFVNELEKQVHKRTKELADTNIELEKMNKELQSFAYISSHDLQEPLRKIQTFSSQIIEKEFQNLSDTGKEKFQRMQNSAQRMQVLVNDLLTYSRTNTQERKFEKMDLNKIIEEVKEDLKEELQQKHATVEADEICEANIIPFQFRQLMFNLLSNSLKFANDNPAPHIKIRSIIAEGQKLNNEELLKEIKYCHISISDNGIGFEQQYSKKIFEVFQRLHGKNQYIGTGIGLAIVKKIVENHDGFITAKGETGKGATFDIYIPTK